MTTFTASEVRKHAELMRTSIHNLDAHTPVMLHAFADHLEAEERAVPVAFCIVGKGEAELVFARDVIHDKRGMRAIGRELGEGAHALYIHSAQAQPPAASVTDAMKRAFEHLASIGYPKNARGNYDKDGEWTFSDAVPRDVDAREVSAAFHALKTALAAQENPNG